MSSHDEKSPVRNGLRDITILEFFREPLMVTELVEFKLTGLAVNVARQPAFADQIHDVLRLLQAVSSRHYGHLSMLALLDILQAVDYFLVLTDEKRDSETDGYEDDAKILAQVFEKHKEEINKFRLWFNHTQRL
jgi:hypothetical protein